MDFVFVAAADGEINRHIKLFLIMYTYLYTIFYYAIINYFNLPIFFLVNKKKRSNSFKAWFRLSCSIQLVGGQSVYLINLNPYWVHLSALNRLLT